MKKVIARNIKRFDSHVFKIFFLMAFCFLNIEGASAQTIVSSLSQLIPYLDDNNANVKMTPGTYYFNTSNCGDGLLFSDPTLILITGSNSTFDFTDVKFEFDTDIFKAYGSVEVIEFQVVGNDNVMLNLTMEDIGDTTPTRTALCMSLDGERNRIEGFTATTRGSYPYGYGDIFGKGSGAVIGHRKHGGCQFRGIDNHLKNCNFYLKSYGHGIFIQGATNALVEGCYVEGELRTTDEVLAEEGTGSPADNVDFMTVWGYTLEPGWTFSLQEDGIRCYTTGLEYGTGATISTTNTSVIDCTVNQMRSGVTIGWDSGIKYVENCTVIANEVGFWVGSDANVVNCRGDVSVGALYAEDAARSGSTVELTIIDNVRTKYGNTPSFYLAGSSHDFTIMDGTSSFNSDIEILVGGTRLGHRWLAGSGEEPPYTDANSISINNQTNYPLTLGGNSSGCTGQSCGNITDNGSNNSVSSSSVCGSVTCGDFDAFSIIEAEDYCDQSGIQTQTTTDSGGGENVGWTNNGDWLKFTDVDFGNGAASFDARVASSSSSGTIELHLGSTTGTLIGSVDVIGTSGWQDWTTITSTVTGVSGVKDLYVVFSAGGLNFNWFKFTASSSSGGFDAYSTIEAEAYTDMSGIQTEATSDSGGGENVGWIDNSDWLKFEDVDFGSGASSVDVRVASQSSGGTFEFRLGSTSGSLIGSGSTSSTGGWQAWTTVSVDVSGVSGTQDLYLIFTSGGININWIEFVAGISCATFSTMEAEDFDNMSGILDESSNIGFVHNGDWIMYDNVDLTCATSIDVRASSPTSGGAVEVRLGSTTGTLVGTASVSSTGNWNSWSTFSANISSVSGDQDVYLVFTGGSGYLFNLDWVEFSSNSSSRLVELSSEQAILEAEFRVYPNPVSRNLTVLISKSVYYQFAIHDIDGKIVHQDLIEEGVSEFSIDINPLKTGVYILKLEGDKVSKVIRIIKD